jgi:hypothetical protein
MTVGTGDLQKQAAGTGQLGEDNRDRTARKGQPGQDSWERTTEIGHPEKTVRMVQRGQELEDGMSRI